MSVKNLDRHNRWRNKTVAFRVSPDEDREIETAVRLSGLTKQDYITRRLLCRDVVVQGNPRVYKALRNELAAVLEELERIEAGNGVDGELLDTIRLIAAIMDGMSRKWCGWGAAGHHPADRRHHGRHEGGLIDGWIENENDRPISVCCSRRGTVALTKT